MDAIANLTVTNNDDGTVNVSGHIIRNGERHLVSYDADADTVESFFALAASMGAITRTLTV